MWSNGMSLASSRFVLYRKSRIFFFLLRTLSNLTTDWMITDQKSSLKFKSNKDPKYLWVLPDIDQLGKSRRTPA